jgi:hypothetical protein
MNLEIQNFPRPSALELEIHNNLGAPNVKEQKFGKTERLFTLGILYPRLCVYRKFWRTFY